MGLLKSKDALMPVTPCGIGGMIVVGAWVMYVYMGSDDSSVEK